MANEQQQAESSRAVRSRTGVVRSTGGHKTIHVVVENLVKHPVYGKFQRRRTKLAAHDPENSALVGDTVEIVPCRRLSKTKSWRLVRIVRRGDEPMAAGGSEV